MNNASLQADPRRSFRLPTRAAFLINSWSTNIFWGKMSGTEKLWGKIGRTKKGGKVQNKTYPLPFDRNSTNTYASYRYCQDCILRRTVERVEVVLIDQVLLYCTRLIFIVFINLTHDKPTNTPNHDVVETWWLIDKTKSTIFTILFTKKIKFDVFWSIIFTRIRDTFIYNTSSFDIMCRPMWGML